MGRHSAPDDDEQVVITIAPRALSRPQPGRHARRDDEQKPEPLRLIAEQDTERLPAPPEPKPEPAPPEPEPEPEMSDSTDLVLAEPASRKVVARTDKADQSTAADLALLREHSDLRARVIAALVAPFVIYTAVMYGIGATHVYFIWVWIPLVTAGVVAGSLLDAAHRRHGKAGS